MPNDPPPVDLTQLLADWPFGPDAPVARLVPGLEGEPRLQIRVEMGILQMNLFGRPDGQEPFGSQSLLEHFELLSDESVGPGSRPGSPREIRGGDRPEPGERPDRRDEDVSGPSPRSETAFSLDHASCQELMLEAAQFQRRLSALESLNDHTRVVRDASRNLRLIDFVAEHCLNEDDAVDFEKLRPALICAKFRATALQLLASNEQRAAAVILDDGLEQLTQWHAARGLGRHIEASPEVRTLRTMRDGLKPMLPASQKAELRDRLAAAIKAENYELAAILRDELKQISP